MPTLSLHALAVETFVPMLHALSELLDKGAEHARTKGSDPAILVGARLAPDMYPLAKQVELACHQADDAVARLTRREPPQHGDAGESLDALKTRIAKSIERLSSTTAAAFDGAEDREIKIVPAAGFAFVMNGFQFLRDWALPHFYFHVVTTYDILRQSGVEIGKKDYLSRAAVYIRRDGAS